MTQSDDARESLTLVLVAIRGAGRPVARKRAGGALPLPKPYHRTTRRLFADFQSRCPASPLLVSGQPGEHLAVVGVAGIVSARVLAPLRRRDVA
jgi:hypothetical protein